MIFVFFFVILRFYCMNPTLTKKNKNITYELFTHLPPGHEYMHHLTNFKYRAQLRIKYFGIYYDMLDLNIGHVKCSILST